MTSVTREALIVADASPVIGLAKIGRLDIFEHLACEVLMPREVWHEVVESGGERPEVALLAARFCGSVRDPDPTLVAQFRLLVDAGEAAALALATTNPGCLILLDDGAGRAVAHGRSIRCIGTAGLLLRAKKAGLIVSLGADLAALRRHGFFLHDALVKKLMTAAGE